MKKDIPINYIPDEYIEELPEEVYEKNPKNKEYILYSIIFLWFMTLLTVFTFWNNITVEDLRWQQLKNASIKLEATTSELLKVELQKRKLELIILQAEKCLELNSQTGAVVDCNLFIKK